MSRAVLISIRPEWCELIVSGKKTVEVRKTKPKIEKPFKCYIYCTIGDNPLIPPHLNDSHYRIHKQNGRKKWKGKYDEGTDYKGFLNGKVIGEFICDNIDCVDIPYPAYQNELDKKYIEKSCIRYYDLHRYAYHDNLYFWHISELKMYDIPKELSEFSKHDNTYDNVLGWAFKDRNKSVSLKRPPQSWCYVEE